MSTPRTPTTESRKIVVQYIKPQNSTHGSFRITSDEKWLNTVTRVSLVDFSVSGGVSSFPDNVFLDPGLSSQQTYIAVQTDRTDTTRSPQHFTASYVPLWRAANSGLSPKTRDLATSLLGTSVPFGNAHMKLLTMDSSANFVEFTDYTNLVLEFVVDLPALL